MAFNRNFAVCALAKSKLGNRPFSKALRDALCAKEADASRRKRRREKRSAAKKLAEQKRRMVGVSNYVIIDYL